MPSTAHLARSDKASPVLSISQNWNLRGTCDGGKEDQLGSQSVSSASLPRRTPPRSLGKRTDDASEVAHAARSKAPLGGWPPMRMYLPPSERYVSL